MDTCLRCEEEIEDLANAERITQVGQGWARLRWLHRECAQRSAIGGLNHLKGTCQCGGGTDDPDPPEMTKRQAALAAVEYWRAHEGRD
jgi:hypothetical protein